MQCHGGLAVLGNTIYPLDDTFSSVLFTNLLFTGEIKRLQIINLLTLFLLSFHTFSDLSL